MATWDLQASAGATGKSLLWRGAWSSASSYNPYDAVSASNGSSYISKTNNANKNPVSNPADWDVLAGGGGSLSSVVIGDTAQGTHPSDAVIIPSFKGHSDAIFTGTPSALDDHFDGTVLDAKWNVTTTATNPTAEVSGSKLHLGGVSANATDGIGYYTQANAALPNSNDFTVSAKMDFVGLGKNNNSATAYGDFKIYNTTNNIGLALRLGANAAATGGGYGQLVALGGANNATPVYILPGLAGIPKYLQLVWTLSTKNTILKFSLDGICWQQWAGISGATSGFTAAILPQRLYFMVTVINGSMALLDVDWVKFTNP